MTKQQSFRIIKWYQ